jgi:DNA-binding MarR family transcriptional regulator
LIPQASLPVEVWVRLLRGQASLRRILSAGLGADHGLTINEYEALLRLSHSEENAIRRVDLARELLLTPSGVTRLLEGLEQAGYVEKGVCDSDARVTYAVLTAPGREKLRQASESHLAQLRDIVDERFTAAEQRTLAELLGRLSGDVDTSECSPA